MDQSDCYIFKFRIIVDVELEVFRDIEIGSESTFSDLHFAILHAFKFDTGEIASFYMSDESWEKGLEIPMVTAESIRGLSMVSTKLYEMVSKPSDKIVYVYDFARMWLFFIEVLEMKQKERDYHYPRVALSVGDSPDQDSKELELFGEYFDENEFNEYYGNSGEDSNESTDS